LTTWATVLKSVVGKLVDSVGATEVLPAGYARATDGELLQRLRSYFHLVVERFHQTPDGALEEYLAGCFWNIRRHRTKGTMSDLLQASEIDDLSVVGWRLPVRCRVDGLDDRAALISWEKEIRFPR